MASHKWTTAERAVLLASLDICVKSGAKIEERIPEIMKRHGFKRTWSQSSGQLKSLGKFFSGNRKKPRGIAELRSLGTSCLKLDVELRDAIRSLQQERGVEMPTNQAAETLTTEKQSLSSSLSDDGRAISKPNSPSQSLKRPPQECAERDYARKRQRMSDEEEPRYQTQRRPHLGDAKSTNPNKMQTLSNDDDPSRTSHPPKRPLSGSAEESEGRKRQRLSEDDEPRYQPRKASLDGGNVERSSNKTPEFNDGTQIPPPTLSRKRSYAKDSESICPNKRQKLSNDIDASQATSSSANYGSTADLIPASVHAIPGEKHDNLSPSDEPNPPHKKPSQDDLERDTSRLDSTQSLLSPNTTQVVGQTTASSTGIPLLPEDRTVFSEQNTQANQASQDPINESRKTSNQDVMAELKKAKEEIEQLRKKEQKLHNELKQTTEWNTEILHDRTVQEQYFRNKQNLQQGFFEEHRDRKDAELAAKEQIWRKGFSKSKQALIDLELKHAQKIQGLELKHTQNIQGLETQKLHLEIENRNLRQEIDLIGELKRNELEAERKVNDKIIEDVKKGAEHYRTSWEAIRQTFQRIDNPSIPWDKGLKIFEWPKRLDKKLGRKWIFAGCSVDNLDGLPTGWTHENNLNRTGVVPAEIEHLMRLICGLEQVQAEDKGNLRFADCFAKSETPSAELIIRTMLAAYAIDWYFRVNFHAEERIDLKLNQIYHAMAEFGNLQVVQYWDKVASLFMSQDPQFRKYKLPALVQEKMSDCKDLFKDLASLDDRQRIYVLQKLHSDLAGIKMDLLHDSRAWKIAYIPPGTPFDPEIMQSTTDPFEEVRWQNPEEYHVQLCLFPALWCMDDKPLSDSVGKGHEYRTALVDSKSFFPEHPGQYKDWGYENEIVGTKAIVLLGKIQPDESKPGSTEQTQN